MCELVLEKRLDCYHWAAMTKRWFLVILWTKCLLNQAPHSITKLLNNKARTWDCVSFASIEKLRGIGVANIVKCVGAMSEGIYTVTLLVMKVMRLEETHHLLQ